MNNKPDNHPDTPESGQQIYRLTITNNRGQVLTCQDFDSYDEAESMRCDMQPYYLEERQPGDEIESIIEKINLPKTCGNCDNFVPYCHRPDIGKCLKNIVHWTTHDIKAHDCTAYEPEHP